MCLVKFIGLNTCSGEECTPVVDQHSQPDRTPNPAYCSGDANTRRRKIRKWFNQTHFVGDRKKSKPLLNPSSSEKQIEIRIPTKLILFCPVEEYAMIESDRDSQLINNIGLGFTEEVKCTKLQNYNSDGNRNELWLNENGYNLTCLEQDLMCFEDFVMEENRFRTMASKSVQQMNSDHQSNKYPVTAIVNYTTTAFKWTQFDRNVVETHMILKYENAKEEEVKSLDDGLTVQPASDFPSEVKGSSQAGDPQIGYTSTSHELRWTQIEQDLLNNEKTFATISCSSMGQNGENKERSTLNKKVDDLSGDGVSQNIESYPRSPFVKLDSTLQYPSPEHSLPVSFDRHALHNKTHGESDGFGNSTWSSTGYKSYCSCSTSLAVRCSTVPYSVEISSNSLNYCIREGAMCCVRCGTSVWRCNKTLSQGVQTTSATTERSNDSIDLSTSRCVSIDAPKLIEPPPTSFRLKTSDTDENTSSLVNVKVSNSDLDRKDYLLGKYLIKPTLSRYKLKRLLPTPKWSNSSIFDKWTQIDFDIKKLTTSEEQKNETVNCNLECTYVEVSFSRNLESVPPPAYLNHSDSQMVFTLLDRQLRNVIATHIIEGNFRDRFGTSSGQSHIKTSSSGDTIGIHSNQAAKGDLELISRKIHSRNPRSRPDKSYKLNGDSLSSKIDSGRNGFGGAYIFSHGPQNVRPPKLWWDHIPTSSHTRDFKIMAAWEVGSSGITVGGLINHGCHLRIVASSNDGRLGSAYAEALLIISEMTRKGIRYDNHPYHSSLSSAETQNISMMIRMQFDSPELASLLACSREDMSVILGIDALKLGVQFIKIQPNVEKGSILLYTKDSVQYLDSFLLDRIFEGIKRLRALHTELVNSFDRSKPHIMPVESLTFLLNRINVRSANYPCYTKSYLTNRLKNQLKTKTTSFGGTLAHCIRANAYYRHSTCPVATDPEAYELFYDLFIPIIKEINSLVKLNHPDQVNYDLPEGCSNLPLPQAVISYRIRYARNLHGFGFPAVLSVDDYKKIEALCQSALLSWTENGLGRCYSIANLREQHPRLYEILSKKHLLMHRRAALLKARGAFRHWPEGRSIYVAPKVYSFLDLVAHINTEDHLKIICIDWSGKHPFLAHNQIAKLMKWLDSRLVFSRQPRLGFLSPSPQNVGTGMQISAFLRYQHLETNRTKLEKLCDCDHFNLRIQYNCLVPSSALSHIIEISNFQCNGLTESRITQRFIIALNKLCNSEIKYPRLCKLPAIRNKRYFQRDLINQLRPLTNF